MSSRFRQPSGQLPLDLTHAPSLARDDLVVGASNNLAIGALDSWPRWPHPVAMLIGPPGSGKTHIAAVWAAQANAEIFRPGWVPAARGFALLIEDVDRAGFDERDVFAAVNAARLGEGSVLLTSRDGIGQLPIQLPDLRSRLGAATLLAISLPDEELLIGVLSKLFADRQIEMDPKLLIYAAARMERSLSFANRFAERIDKAALASKGKVSRALVQQVLTEMEVETPHQS